MSEENYVRESKVIELKLLHRNFIENKWDIPNYGTIGSAAVDLLAAIDEDIIINPNTTVTIPSGIAVNIKDPNYALIMMPRSGAGCKLNITLGNTLGLIDSDYQGEIKMCIRNKTSNEIEIKSGQHICQLMLIKSPMINFKIVKEFSNETERGENGFGHSR